MKRSLVVCVVLALALEGASALAQTTKPAAPVSFEVASVKPSDPNASGNVFGAIPSMRPQGAGGIAASNMPLRLLIRMAYGGLQDFQIVGGPSWQMTSKFDIAAKTPEGTTIASPDMQSMMKTLLADRFKLKTHTETRELPIYALMIARSDGKLGPDIKPSSSDCSNAAADAQKRAEELAKGGGSALLSMLAKGETIPCMIMPAINPSNPTAGFGLRGNGQAMSGLTQLLTQVTGRIVHDKTGLTGLYDFELRFDPQVLMAMLPQLGINVPAPGANAAPNPSDSPALLTALQEQLGLKLDSQKGPVEVLVIDSAEMPQPD
jgi:bla regulator protein blaR1